MKRIFVILFTLFLVSCGIKSRNDNERIVTVSIAPFKYFIEAIAGNDFSVNVMVPAGADPHVYEPVPEQITRLRNSSGYISNGYLGFEMNWLERFYETNKTMKKLCLGDKIIPIVSEHQHEGEHVEGADPHYWVSPVSAKIMAVSVKEFLISLNPAQREKYKENCQTFLAKIEELDRQSQARFSSLKRRSFMIYHPNFAYIARDYNLEEIAVEFEGKEPPPSRLREMIDHARLDSVKIIFVQREYDPKNANAIAKEIGAEVKIVDPLSEEWLMSTTYILDEIYNALNSKIR
jgi:zinc transport system substrate-binding protein